MRLCAWKIIYHFLNLKYLIMKTLIFFCFALLCFSATTVKAQSLFDKVDQALNKVDKASNTADRTKGTSDKVFGLLKKKKNTDDLDDANTIINISGINLSNLKKLNENLKACDGVEETKMKFSASVSTIAVVHAGTTEDLLTAIQKSSNTIFTDDDVKEMDEDSISIELKKD